MPYSEKSLFQLKSFQYALWTPITLAVLTVIYIIFTSDLSYQKGFLGLNSAWDIFKVPLAIFSLIFPSVALVTANHRSIQSKKQIELTSTQNTLKNYYDSISDFEKYLDSFSFQKAFLYRNKRVLYKKFFPLNTPKTTNTKIDIKVLSAIKKLHQDNVNNLLKEVSSEKYLKAHNKNMTSPNDILLDVYNKIKSSWLVNFGIEINKDSFDRSEKVVDVIDALTNEFYSLLAFCMDYSSENGVVICEHDSFITSESWILFANTIENHFKCKLAIIDFDALNIDPVKINLL